MGKARRGQLRLHERSAEEAAASDEVLLEEFGNNVPDVDHVDFVDDSVERLAKRLPGLALVLGRGLVQVLRQTGQFEGWNVHAARAAVDDLGGHQLRRLDRGAKEWRKEIERYGGAAGCGGAAGVDFVDWL